MLDLVKELGPLPVNGSGSRMARRLGWAGFGLLGLVALLWLAYRIGAERDLAAEVRGPRPYLLYKQQEQSNNLVLLDTMSRVFDRTEQGGEIFISGSGSVERGGQGGDPVQVRYRRSYAAALARGVKIHRIQFVKPRPMSGSWHEALAGWLSDYGGTNFRLTLVKDEGLNFRQMCLVNPLLESAFVEQALSVNEDEGVSLAGTALIVDGDKGLAQELHKVFDRLAGSGVGVRTVAQLDSVLGAWTVPPAGLGH